MKRMKDITGERFGRLVALHPTNKRKYGSVVWECKCDCGNTILKLARDLCENKVRSCGCVKGNDLAGQRFGRLVVIRPTEERQVNCVVWECKCDCGNIIRVRSGNLTSGKTQSCGCISKGRIQDMEPKDEMGWEMKPRSLAEFNRINREANGMSYGQYTAMLRREKEKQEQESRGDPPRREGKISAYSKDLTGQRFGKLTAIRPTEERKSGQIIWECKCDCGNTVFVRTNSLVSGNTKSCGCLRNGVKVDLTGKRIGRLVVLRPTEQRKNGCVVWECKCDCGNIVYHASADLSAGRRRSCGCLCLETMEEKARPALTPVDGTRITSIESCKTIQSNNKTGYNGVINSFGKYRAIIGFKGKSYYLGLYEDIEEALEARKKAEELLFGKTKEYYTKWKEKAEKDPRWAEENPIHITVEKTGKCDFDVVFEPDLEEKP